MARAQMTAEWEPRQYASTETSGGPAAVILALDEWRSLTPNCGRSDSRSRRRSRREEYRKEMG